MPDWYTREGEGIFRLRVRAVPGAKKPGLAGLHGSSIKVRTDAPPEGGKANASIGAMLASALGVRASCVTHVSGAVSRDKVYRVEGVSEAELDALIG